MIAVLLAAGGALAGSALAGGSPAGSPGPGANLNAALSAAAGNSSTASSAHRRLGALARLRRLGGMYGQFSTRTKTGATRTITFERGVVTSAGSDLVVKAANGTTWTWRFTPSTVVRKGGAKGSRTDLSAGEHVVVAGPLAAGARDARVILVRGTKPAAGAKPSPSASAAAGTSTS